MPFAPDYGQTPVDDDELDQLLPSAVDLLDEPITKAAVYDLEQGIHEQVASELTVAVLEGVIGIDDLLGDSFLRDLHSKLYADIWTWAGKIRKREINIGVAPEQIAVELRASLDTIRWRWQHTSDWTARELGIATHAETVRIHPFTDGNGRTTRLLGDLVFLAAQTGDEIQQYHWEFDKDRYIALLREYDLHRDARALAAFVPMRSFGE